MIRSAQTESGSPIETQTSVWTKSTPLTASFESSVSVTFAPVSAAVARAPLDELVHAARAASARARRTSIPSFAPPSRSVFPMLLRASPR